MHTIRRNYVIDLLKFIFSIVIVLYHINTLDLQPRGGGYLIAKSGFIAVEFFFIVSGYLLAQSTDRQTDRQTDSFCIIYMAKIQLSSYIIK